MNRVKKLLCVCLAIICIMPSEIPSVMSYQYIPEEITIERMGDRAELYFLSSELLKKAGGEEKIAQWQKLARRKHTYFSPNTVDLIDYLALSDEEILSCFQNSPNREREIQILKYRKAGSDGKGADPETLYEDIYGGYYLYAFPYPLLHEIGLERFDAWREALVKTDPSLQKINLPKLLNDFSITDEHFRELIAGNQLEYFFTRERVEDVLRQRAWADEIQVGEDNPRTGAC